MPESPLWTVHLLIEEEAFYRVWPDLDTEEMNSLIHEVRSTTGGHLEIELQEEEP